MRLKGGLDFKEDRKLSKDMPGVTLHGLEKRQSLKVKPVPKLKDWTHLPKQLSRLKVDVVISALYPDLIPKPVLDAFPGRVVNLHPALLPAYRGGTPIASMLWDRRIHEFGGMSLHLVEEGFDTGDLLGQVSAEYGGDGNLTAYYAQLIKGGTNLLSENFANYLSGNLQPISQHGENGPQSRAFADVFEISSKDDLEHTVWRIQHVVDLVPVRLAGLDRSIFVKSIDQLLRPPDGSPPVVGEGWVDFDLSDQRVKFTTGRLR